MSSFSIRSALPHELHILGLQRLTHKPGFKPEMCRVVVVGGQIIGYVLSQQYALRYGTVRLKVAGVGNLFILPEYRGRDYGSALMQDALTYMKEQGAQIALLNDPSGYFRRFGFSPVWPLYRIEFSSQQAALLAQPLSLRPLQANEIPRLADLYEQQWAGRVGFIRKPEVWAWRVLQAEGWHVLAACDAAGKIHGYIAGYDLMDQAVEVLADTPAAALTLIAEGGRLHQSAGSPMVRWHIPPDDALIAFARDILDVTLSAHFALETGWGARIIDSASLIRELLPEIVSQARAALPDFHARDLMFEFGSDSVRVGLRKHETTQVDLYHRDFIQMMFGSLTPRSSGARAHAHPDAVTLLEALFPARVASLGMWDWF